MKKSLFAVSVLSIAIVSGSAAAAVTTGQLNFNWQGLVPTAPVTNTAWAFVDALDMPYTPGTEQLNVVLDNTTKGLTATGVKKYDFFVVPITGAATPGTPVTRGTTLNSVKAYLGSAPVSSGFVGNKQLTLSTAAAAADGEVAITMNGTALSVGSATSTTVPVTAGTNPEAHVVIDMNAKAASADVIEGGAISFTAPVVFSVDI